MDNLSYNSDSSFTAGFKTIVISPEIKQEIANDIRSAFTSSATSNGYFWTLDTGVKLNQTILNMIANSVEQGIESSMSPFMWFLCITE